MTQETLKAKPKFVGTLAFPKIQNSIELGKPVIISAPPGFGQLQIIQAIAELLGLSTHTARLNDDQLVDSAYLRALIHRIDEGQETHNKLQHLLILEHQAKAASPERLESMENKYTDAIKLSRIDHVLPILITPLHPDVLVSADKALEATKEICIIFTHELLTHMPLASQQLFAAAPPHLHQSLIGIIRLAESCPPMSAIFNAKLKGLQAYQALNQESQTPSSQSQALKVVCSELLNNFQDLMADLAEKILSQEEKHFASLLSLFPSNLYHYLYAIENIQPQVQTLIKRLIQKQVLQIGQEHTPEGLVTLISFSSLAWRFYSQGNLRRTLSANRLDLFIHKVRAQLQNNESLAIDFAISSRCFELALEIITTYFESHKKETELNIDQAVIWLRQIPQRLINQNKTAKYILSFHRMKQRENDKQIDQNNTNHSLNQNKISLHRIADPSSTIPATYNPTVDIQPSREISSIDQNQKPRVYQENKLLNTKNSQLDVNSLSKLNDQPEIIQRVSSASLLMELNYSIETGDYKAGHLLAEAMMNDGLNQQIPEIFVQSLAYLWFLDAVLFGQEYFINRISELVVSNRLNNQLNGLRIWIIHLKETIESILSPTDNEKIKPLVAPKIDNLSTAGHYLMGYLSAYANALSCSSRLEIQEASEHVQEAGYLALNTSDVISETLLPIWLIDFMLYMKQNRIREGLSLTQAQTKKEKSGIMRTPHPILHILKEFTALVEDKEHKQLINRVNESATPKGSSSPLEMVAEQLLATAYLIHHQSRLTQKTLHLLLNKLNSSGSFLPWSFLGPLSAYLFISYKAKDKDIKFSAFNKQEAFIELLCRKSQFIIDHCYLDLSKREAEILSLLVIGSSNEEIANLLCRSLGTVKLHVHSIYKKLGVNNRVNAIKKCQLSGFFSFGL